MAESWVVPEALDGERLDRALALLTSLSRREVNLLIELGRASVGGTSSLSRSRRVQSGETISLDADPSTAGPPALAADPAVDVPVAFSDQDLIIVDKPAGLVVHPAPGNRYGTLVHGLLARFPDLADLAIEPGHALRPGIVHRLDKGTSGLLAVARTSIAQTSLGHQLRQRTLKREYLALVAGTIESDTGTVDAPLGRSEKRRTLTQVRADGRPARTHYEVVGRWVSPVEVTLLRCRLESGRTHQIRVHFSAIGHPVVGDERYGWRPVGGWHPLPAGRPFLHAAALELEHPRSGARLRFCSELPPDLGDVVEELRAAAPGR